MSELMDMQAPGSERAQETPAQALGGDPQQAQWTREFQAQIQDMFSQLASHQESMLIERFAQMQASLESRIPQAQGTPITRPATNSTTDLTPVPPISSIKRPRPRLPDPEKFNGEDLSLYPQFEGKLHAKLEIDRPSIGEAKEQLWYGFSRLEGKAAARIYPWIATYSKTNKFTLEEFYVQLRTAFQDPALQDKALIRLNTLRQGNRSFNELLTEFDRLLLEAGGHGWDHNVKKGYIKSAINNTLRDRMITVEEKPTYEEYCMQIKGIADRLSEFKRVTTQRC
jgi:hypothetical protein